MIEESVEMIIIVFGLFLMAVVVGFFLFIYFTGEDY